MLVYASMHQLVFDGERGAMLTVAGGIILAVLFFVFLPLILRLVWLAVGALFCIAIVGLVGYGIVSVAANLTLHTRSRSAAYCPSSRAFS